MSKVIYIAGLGHSGSTLLDMSLGTLPSVIGLGEIKTILDPRTREGHFSSRCSCGKQAMECDVWGKVPQLLKNVNNNLQGIGILHDLLKEQFGPDVILVDASKNSYPYLEELNSKHELKVIYLTRDVRSWSYSRFLSTGKPALYFAIRWVLENIKLRSRFRKMGIQPMWIGYEELALYPEHILPKIADFCGLKFANSMLEPSMSNSHIISGNIARSDPEKKAGWKYDARWLLSRRIMLLSPLFAFFRLLHLKFVYSHLTNKSLSNFFLFGTERKNEMNRKFN